MTVKDLIRTKKVVRVGALYLVTHCDGTEFQVVNTKRGNFPWVAIPKKVGHNTYGGKTLTHLVEALTDPAFRTYVDGKKVVDIIKHARN